ncbi:MAG: thioredoxin family protein [Akkermansia sp.]
MFKKALTLLMPLAMVAPSFAAEWLTELPAAQAKAAAENKAILVDFTGSDWCGWCIRLRKNVFDTPEFDSYVKDKFVLLEIDLPRGNKLTPEQKAVNEALAKRFKITGFPTVLVLTPNAEVAGGFGGGQPNLAAVQPSLDKALEVAALIKKAEGQQGVDKAKSLAAAYLGIPSDLRNLATSLRDQALALDPEDVTGLQREAKAQRQRAAIMRDLREVKTPQKAVEVFDAWLAKPELMKENLTEVHFMKSNAMLAMAETEEDVAAAEAEALKGADASTAADAAAVRAHVIDSFKDKGAMLRMIKARRR